MLFFALGRIDDHRLDGPGCDLMAVGVDVRTHELVRSGIEQPSGAPLPGDYVVLPFGGDLEIPGIYQYRVWEERLPVVQPVATDRQETNR
jgi:hypothetical protein